MKNILKIAATLSLLSGAAAADPELGVWKTTPDDNGNFGHIKVAECEGEICGTLIKSFDSTGASYKSENIGKQIIWAMKNKGDGKYGGNSSTNEGDGWGSQLGVSISRKLHLHARSLVLPHPADPSRKLRLVAEMPEHMKNSWDFFGWQVDDEAAADPFEDEQ